ncbi:hypothetical protein SUGI_0182530 [Cryptomeria japonica]|uniref:uncharacterized protein LOC131050817 n=1 Tax=Cryptomeria japonica TaxID=3369 RepID=UPI002408CFDC|nr:uncharacterized protein LOC131050817 [Cryptomeria japonica]GLJ12035.1 hypothetical protein SUGI_0182530 [Cryptomeria japonica]
MSIFSFISWRDWSLQLYFIYCGMTSQVIKVDTTTEMHCWVPTTPSPKKPTLVLIHGFGANAMWQWYLQIRPLLHNFNVYVPDLVFFGKSYFTGNERSEFFQAESVMKLLKQLGVTRFHLGGISYGGFVAYRLAHLFPDSVEKVVIISSGVCMVYEDKDELFKNNDSLVVADILLPKTPDHLRLLMKFSLNRPPTMVPSFILQDFINVMYTEQRERKVELLQHVAFSKEGAPPLPVLNQETLIIWGADDLVFPLELGHRLKRHLGDKAKLVVLKEAGHAVQLESPHEFNNVIKTFLIGSSL